jgi:signal transduction histidine kinase
MCENEVEFQIQNGMFPWIIRRREPAIVPSVIFKNRKTIIMLPLSTKRRTLGVVLVLTPIEQGSVTQENLKLLGMLAKQCSLVMENTVLYEELKEEHESLKKAQGQLVQAEKLTSLGGLTRGASHEILNPLNSISVCLQLMMMDKSLNRRALKYLHTMMDQSRRISNVVKGLLEFSQDTEPKRESLDINILIDKAASRIEQEYRFRHIRITKKLDRSLPLIIGDQDRLLQVLHNLLSNSEEAMCEGGTIHISTRGPAENMRSWNKPHFIEIVFQDTGHGISPEHINRVFDPFFTTREASTGLGLSLCYGIVRDHGGSIHVKSLVNRETVFTICLPVV